MTSEPFVADPDFTLYVGDALGVLAELPDESVHCCVTSPPYWGLRDYGTGSWEGGDPECDHRPDTEHQKQGVTSLRQGRSNVEDQRNENFRDACGKCGAFRVDQQLGLEATPDEYVARMVEVFREVRRVLRNDGTLWLNLGDSYAGSSKGGAVSEEAWLRLQGDTTVPVYAGGTRPVVPRLEPNSLKVPHGLKPKDLVGIPWRLAFALQADGWYLRSDIIWSKPNPMPESIRDRPTKSHEYVFMLAKSPRYFWDQEAVREPHSPDGRSVTRVVGQDGSIQHRDGERWPNAGRNVRSVWEIATQPYPEAHFATYPEELVRRCILAGTSERGCCPECGASWERQTSRGVPPREVAPSEIDRYGTGDAGVHRKVGGQYQKWLDENPLQTVGWEPSCECGEEQGVIGQVGTVASEPIPCIVLDPFMGSGTTAFVARNHGRRSVGIELNVEYARLAAKRLEQQSLFA